MSVCHRATHFWSTAAEHKDFPELEDLFPSVLGTQGRVLERATADFANVAGVGIRQETGRFDPLPSCKAVVWHCVRNPWSMLAGQINGLARLRPVLTLHAIVATFMHDGGFRFSSQLWMTKQKKQDMVQHYNHSQIRHCHGHVFMMRIISRGTPAAKLAALTRRYST